MSYEHGRSPLEQQLPYPCSFPGEFQTHPDPRTYQNPPYTAAHYNPADYRAREPSPTKTRQDSIPLNQSGYLPQQQQPTYDAAAAVNNAFDNSAAANQVPQEIIEKITQQVRDQVIDSLKASGISTAQPQQTPNYTQPVPPPSQSQPQAQQFHAPPPMQAYVARSPTASTTGSVPPRSNVYTPPTPDRHDYERDRATGASYSPDHMSEASFTSKENASTKNDGRDRTYFSSREDVSAKPSEKVNAPPEKPHVNAKEDLTDRYGERERPIPQTDGSSSRPSRPVRGFTFEEETTVEKIWQPLFEDGEPTKRLGQFLRGVALHIIEDYEPKNSLVITPAKMRRFYEDVKLSAEPYPWRDIFNLNDARLSKLYRDLKCEHFFVQDSPTSNEEPHIPALTPFGFQTYMTALIQAHPDTEFDRLAKTVLDMPISNADDRKERFPKEISRRLFPKSEDPRVKQKCIAALSADGMISLPKSTTTSFPPPPSTQPPPNTSFERDRKPYGGPPPTHNAATRPKTGDEEYHSDRETTPLAVPIERERKPYTAREGTGKVHQPDISSSTGSLKGDLHRRSESHSGYLHRDGVADKRPAPPSVNPNVRRNRSPSFSGNRSGLPNLNLGEGYSHSESAVSDIPSAYYASNLYDDPSDQEKLSTTGSGLGLGRRKSTRDRRDRDRDERDRYEERDRKDRYQDSRTAEWPRRAAEEDRYADRYKDEREREYAEDYYRRYGKVPGAPDRRYP